MRRPWLRGWTRAAARGGTLHRVRDGTTLLMAAASGGQEAMVRMLLQRGASVNLQNSDGATALMHAAIRDHTTIVQALLDAKADASPQNANNYTALMIAEHYKHAATAQLLRQHAKQQTLVRRGRRWRTLRPLLPRPTFRAAACASTASRGGPSSMGSAAWRGASTRPRGGTRWRWRARRRPCC